MTHRVTILHTNDFHNGLSAEQAHTLARAKDDAGADTLLIDAGDAISAGNVGVRPAGEPILVAMSEVGYDAMTMGNREFHVSDIILRHKIGSAGFPILCANMRYRSGGDSAKRALPVQPVIERTLPCGARIGIIGATVPMVTERMTARIISAYLFDDPVEVVTRLARELRPRVDLLIAMTHIGIKADEALSAACPDLDLIVTGHTHLVVHAGERTSGAPIVQTGWYAHNFGKVVFEIGDGRPRLVDSYILPLEPAGR